MSVINKELGTITDEQLDTIVKHALEVPEMDGERMSYILKRLDALRGICHLQALAIVIRSVWGNDCQTFPADSVDVA